MNELVFVSIIIDISQLFVKSFKMINVNFTLHKVAHFIKFDMNFLNDYDRQMIKKI